MAHVCIFKVRDTALCLPIEQVQQVVESAESVPVPLSPPSIVGLVNLRGLVVTCIDPRVVLGLPVEGPLPTTHLVALAGGQPMSIRVDEVVGVVEVDDNAVRPLPNNLPPRRRELARGVVCNDDELVLVLDANRIAAAVPTAA